MLVLTTRIRNIRRGPGKLDVIRKRGKRSALSADDTGVVVELRKTRTEKSKSTFLKVCFR